MRQQMGSPESSRIFRRSGVELYNRLYVPGTCVAVEVNEILCLGYMGSCYVESDGYVVLDIMVFCCDGA
jgi:hypothetical protein